MVVPPHVLVQIGTAMTGLSVIEHFGENSGDMIWGGFGGDFPGYCVEEVSPVAATLSSDSVLRFDAATKVGYLEVGRFEAVLEQLKPVTGHDACSFGNDDSLAGWVCFG